VFGEFFPNPSGSPLTTEARARMSPMAAFGAEVIGTAILLLVILCVTDKHNQARPQILTAATIGLTVTLLISLLGPLTMACFNPARDFAPRVFSALAGWGDLPFQVNGLGWLTVYIIAPLLGGLLGGGIYRALFSPAYSECRSDPTSVEFAGNCHPWPRAVRDTAMFVGLLIQEENCACCWHGIGLREVFMHRQYKMTKAAARPILGVVLGFFVLVFGVLASGASVHHTLHHDANSHSGSCAICSFAKGQVEAADSPLAVCQPVIFRVIAATPIVSSLPQNPSFLLPPGRAPPVFSVVS
jgi:hypothetical protein